MPRPAPHPLALFSLIPSSDQAHAVVAHPSNSHLVSITPKGVHALDVGLHIRSRSRNTLATLGRNDTDIIMEESSIGRFQCSFEMDPESGSIVLYDRSNNQTTQVFGDHAIQFEHGRLRRVVVQPGLNTVIGMGGVRCNLVQFLLHWHQTLDETVKKVKHQENIPCAVTENPRLARTRDEPPSVSITSRETRAHTLGEQKPKIRYIKVGLPLGSRQFGTVHKVVNVDSGKFMAVKILEQPTTKSKQEKLGVSPHRALKHEVEALSRIKHTHIIDFIWSQGWDEPQVEIFMGLKEGTLWSLVQSGDNASVVIAKSVFQQMLEALDCIACVKIIHRDVKPENILYISQPGGRHQFQLADFGLCIREGDTTTSAGSQLYMAPEIFRGGRSTCKLDVWSLFVTIMWILDVGGFRQGEQQFQTVEDVQKAVLSAARNELVQIQEMAIVDPEERASAAQMLVKHFNGSGLSTRQIKVPALTQQLCTYNRRR